MPGIYQLACGTCDYAVSGIMSMTTVVMADGSVKVCMHPCEETIAQEATGTTWSELVGANRIVYRYALVCLACGKLDYYGPRDLSAKSHTGGHIRSIVHQPSPSEALAYLCKACGARQLYPLCGPTGGLHGLPKLFGLFRERVVCPKCKKGVLRSEIIAKS